MRLVVVGGGMQGLVIARNLASRTEKPAVVVADIKAPARLPEGVSFRRCDALDPRQAAELLKGADAAVLAVPSPIARAALANVLAAGVPVADVSFTADPPLDLDAAAKKSGACCVVDCGIAPGLSHILLGGAHAEWGGLDRLRIWVGGMPQVPPPVFRHAVYFNPHDLISEYVRPARARTGGRDVSPAPMDVASEPFTDPELGPLEAFLSDGLRSLLTSYPDVPDMAELTLRWPGHLDAMRALDGLGALRDGAASAALGNLLAARYPAEAHHDVLVMVVEAARGTRARTWRLVDRRTDGESAMSRTTGYTTAAVAMTLARRTFAEPGVHAPERLGRHAPAARALVAELAERGIRLS